MAQQQMSLPQAFELAVGQHQAGKLAEAEAIYRQILSVDPNQPDVMHLLGVIACQVGKFDVAVELVRRAISIQPNSVDFYGTLGNALQSLAQYNQAIASYQKGLSLNPNNPEILNNLGCAFRDIRQSDQALEAFRRALAIRPQYLAALNNLANALLDAGQLQSAGDSLRQSLSFDPDNAETHNSLGAVLERQAQYAEAVASYRKAISLSPNHVEAHANLGITLLREGNYPHGWAEYEWRLNRKDALARSESLGHKPRWRGESLAGQTILLDAEQGFGDTIQFARYIPLVADRGGRIILRCQPELRRLLHNFPELQEAITMNDRLPDFDWHCPLASLPPIFDTRLETIPNHVPHFHADESSARSWASRLEHQGRLKVGLAWAGRGEHRDDRNRSMSLSLLKELIDENDAAYVSLQKGPAAAHLSAQSFAPKVNDWTRELHDFADTAALVCNLDLIISVDTSVAHLGAAMGKPVWVLLPFVPDWRWMLDRVDSPWYPTMQLFRQPAIGDWQTPVQRISRALKEFRRNS